MARLFLCAAAKFSRLFQNFKGLMRRYPVTDWVSSFESRRLSRAAILNTCACKPSQGYVVALSWR